MKNILLLSLLTLMTGAVTYAAPITKSYKLDLSAPGKPVNFDVDLYNGSISVEGYDGEVVEVTATFEELDKVSKDDSKNTKKDSDNSKKNQKSKRSTKGLKKVENRTVRLEIEENNNSIEISSDMQNRHIKLVLKVPTRSKMELSTFRGNFINVTSVTGALELSSHSGSITASNINGPIVAETFRGEIIASFNKFSKDNPTSFTSHNGSIDVTLPSKTKARFEVKSYQGEIFSGLDAEFLPEDENGNKVNKGNKQKIVIGGLMAAEINGGGQKISISTFGGDIYLRKK